MTVRRAPDAASSLVEDELYVGGTGYNVVPKYGSYFVRQSSLDENLSLILGNDVMRGVLVESATTQAPYQSTIDFGMHWHRLDRFTDLKEKPASDTPDLVVALMDLYSVRREAEEEDIVAPKPEAVSRAENVLRAIYKAAPRPYAVYPMPEGEIAIDAHSRRGTKVVVICDADGSARCLVYLDNEFAQKEYDDLSLIPDNFVKEALDKTQSEA